MLVQPQCKLGAEPALLTALKSLKYGINLLNIFSLFFDD